MNILLATSTTAMSGEGVYNYGLVIFLMMTGLYLVLAKGNMIKSVIGLNIFQVSVIMFYVSMGRVEHGTAPILLERDIPNHESEHGHEHDGDTIDHDTDHGDHGDHGRIQTHSDVALVSTADDGHSTDDGSDHNQTQSDDTDDTESNSPSIHTVDGRTAYSNPLPHVLMLTAIVVGVATTALALALVVRIREYYETIEEDIVDVIEKRLQKEESQS